MGKGRRKVVCDETKIGVYHCDGRCIDVCFLSGDDPRTGRSYDHRRGWIADRLERLASVFGIDVGPHLLLDHQYHVLLRNRPDVVASWSDEEVVQRWLRLSTQSLELHPPAEEVAIAACLQQPDKVSELRGRLSHISWFMRMFNESLARAANREDMGHGCFWAMPFGCRALTSDTAIQASAKYFDLDHILAMLVENPATAELAHSLIASRAESLRDRREGKISRARLPFSKLIHGI